MIGRFGGAVKYLAIALAAAAMLGTASLAEAKDPQIRVGVSSVCPASNSVAGAEFAPIVAAILVDLAVQASAAMIDALNAYLTTPGTVTLQNSVPVATFLSSSPKGVTFDTSVHCVWVAVATDFQSPKVDSTGKVLVANRNPLSTDVLTQDVPFADPQYKQQVIDYTGATSPLLLYFEGVIVPSSDNTAWRIVPKAWYYPKFLQSSNVFQSNSHDLAFTVQYSAPGKDSAPFATYTLNQQALDEGQLTLDDVTAKATGWMALPSYNRPQDAVGGFYPVNVTAQVVESRHPNELATVLGKVAEDQKSAIGTAVGNKVQYAVSEPTRAADKQTNATAAQTANDAYNKAYDAASAAYTAYTAATKANPQDPGTVTRTLTTARLDYQALNIAQNNAQAAMGASNLPFKALPPLNALPQ